MNECNHGWPGFGPCPYCEAARYKAALKRIATLDIDPSQSEANDDAMARIASEALEKK